MQIEAGMTSLPDNRTEAAVYWAAVSLIVCEGLSIEKAAERLAINGDRLRDILHKRQTLRPFSPSSYPPTRPLGLQ